MPWGLRAVCGRGLGSLCPGPGGGGLFMPSTPLTISSGRQPWASGQMAGGASWTLVGEKLIGWWCVCTGLCGDSSCPGTGEAVGEMVCIAVCMHACH